MKYYVVADVHGYYNAMKKALKDAGFFEEKEPHKLIVCGDLLDRGNEARQVIDFMMELKKQAKLIYIKGNHEELFIQCLQEIARGGTMRVSSVNSHHNTNGTWGSILQIAKMDEIDALNMSQELVARVRESDFYQELLGSCVDYFETQNYVFVHGWIPCHAYGFQPKIEYEYEPNWRNADLDLWHRSRWINGMEAWKNNIREPNKVIVCGHWHASYGHACIKKKGTEFGNGAINTPFVEKGIIALDARTSASGFVNCVVIDD